MLASIGRTRHGSAEYHPALPGYPPSPDGAPATRLLSHHTLRAVLDRYRLPRYSALREYLGEYDIYFMALRLWRALFPEESLPQGDAWDVEQTLLDFVSQDLFPLDDYTDEVAFNAGEHPLGCPIFIESYGLPWEIATLEELGAGVAPLAALVLPALSPAAWLADTALMMVDQARDWLAERDVTLPDPERFSDHAATRVALAALPPPLDGLVTVYCCLCRDTGNMFLDNVPCIWQGDYELWEDMPYWDVEAIRALARQYAEVRVAITQMFTYYEWVERAPGAPMRVLRELCALFALEIGESDDD